MVLQVHVPLEGFPLSQGRARLDNERTRRGCVLEIVAFGEDGRVVEVLRCEEVRAGSEEGAVSSQGVPV